MKAREHRGDYAESMATEFEFETKDDLLKEINSRMVAPFGADDIGFVHHGVDNRNGWDSYLVSVRGYGVFGYTNGMPK